LTRLIATWLYGISAADLLTFVAAPLLILLLASAACLIAAWRATRIDPATALRYE
jgi:ABC-type lipoprotein release transport system permease subunit